MYIVQLVPIFLVTMCFEKYFLLVLFLFISPISCFSIFGHRNVMKFLLEEINNNFTTYDPSRIKTKWIEQPVDHFNEKDNRTWKMRYLQRLDMWKNGGPIYLFIGGEDKIGKKILLAGTTYELAKETNGAMFVSEHRYYGKSKPFDQFTTENLKYLSVKQALADLARLLTYLKSKPKFSESKVVAIGGSYAGNLAAWLKLLYPNSIDAAVASSGPVLAKTDFYEYLETVGVNFAEYGLPGCYGQIENIFKEYEHNFKTEAGINKLKEEEQICDETDMTKLVNQQFFFTIKASPFMEISQYGDVNSIKQLCAQLIDSSRVIPDYNVNTDIWNIKYHCNDYEFDNWIDATKSMDGFKAWTYQTCTEFGFFQTTTTNNHPFTNNIPVELHFKTCTDIFGKDFDEKRVEDGVKNTNEMYSGLNPNVTKVVFVNGELDPWHRLSVLEDINNEAPAKLIPFSSHCKDLFPNKEGDPEELHEARRYVKSLVKKWIGANELVNS